MAKYFLGTCLLALLMAVCLSEAIKKAADVKAVDVTNTELTHERKKRAIVGCNGVLTAPTGIIYTENYPNDYPAHSECRWRISVPWPYTKIRLEFVPKIELEGSYLGICVDVVTVYDGRSSFSPRHSSWCGKGTVPVIHSTGRHMYITFRADSSIHHRGFLATYTALKSDNTTNCA